jgi:hypothetical protein
MQRRRPDIWQKVLWAYRRVGSRGSRGDYLYRRRTRTAGRLRRFDRLTAASGTTALAGRELAQDLGFNTIKTRAIREPLNARSVVRKGASPTCRNARATLGTKIKRR